MKFTNHNCYRNQKTSALNPLMWGNTFAIFVAARSLVHAYTRTFSRTCNERLMNFKIYVSKHAHITPWNSREKSNLEMYFQGRMRWNYERRRLLLMPVGRHFPQKGETNVVTLFRNSKTSSTPEQIPEYLPTRPRCYLEFFLKGQSNILSRKKYNTNSR